VQLRQYLDQLVLLARLVQPALLALLDLLVDLLARLDPLALLVRLAPLVLLAQQDQLEQPRQFLARQVLLARLVPLAQHLLSQDLLGLLVLQDPQEQLGLLVQHLLFLDQLDQRALPAPLAQHLQFLDQLAHKDPLAQLVLLEQA
jgi:hypothetical protein